MIYIIMIPLQVCVSFAAAVLIGLPLILLSPKLDECADSTVLADWQFCET